ncbi:MAG: hypothetical protein U5N26_09195 [Candidatus Marinimicrobia bacterium]|nr:hypothetical protein [Candidatus Neomarinimicrobiota bacterium]
MVVDENFSEGLKAILQVHGIGGLRPNTLLLGWTRDSERSGCVLHDPRSVTKNAEKPPYCPPVSRTRRTGTFPAEISMCGGTMLPIRSFHCSWLFC